MTGVNCLRWTQLDQIKYHAVSVLFPGGGTTPAPEVVLFTSDTVILISRNLNSSRRVAPGGWCLNWVSQSMPAGFLAAHDSHQKKQQKDWPFPRCSPEVAAYTADGTRLRPWGLLALEELLVGERKG